MSKNYKGKSKSSTDKKEAEVKKDTGTTSKSRGSRGKGKSGKPYDNHKAPFAGSSQLAISATQVITSANIPYGYPAGLPIIPDLARLKGLGTNSTVSGEIGGIMALYTDPHVGISRGPDSVINLAAKRFFTDFTYANGRNPDYESADAIMVAIAVAQAATMYVFAVRAYNVLCTFSGFNRYLPRALFQCMGLDYDDFVMNLGDFAHWLENYRLRLQKLWVPTTLPAIGEWLSMFKDIYVDEPDNPKAQIEFYVPNTVWKYDAKTADTGSKLTTTSFIELDEGGGLITKSFSELATFMDSLIGILMYDDDVNKIMADIMLAYGPNSVIDLAPANIGSPVDFVYDPLVSATMKNSTNFTGTTTELIAPAGVAIDSQDVYQYNNVVLHAPIYEVPNSNAEEYKYYIGAKLLNSPTSAPDALLNIAMTRNTVLVPNVESDMDQTTGLMNPGWHRGSDVTYVTSHSMGVATIARVMIIQPDISSDNGSYNAHFIAPIAAVNSLHASIAFGVLNFTDMPPIDIYAGVGGSAQYRGNTSTMDYYTILPEEDLRKIHETYVLAQFSAGLTG